MSTRGTTPELARPIVVKLLQLAATFRQRAHMVRPKNQVQGLVVCFEGQAVAWMPQLENPKAFPVGTFAVDEEAEVVYLRELGRNTWAVAYART